MAKQEARTLLAGRRAGAEMVSLSSSPGVPSPAALDEFKSHQSILAPEAPEGGHGRAAIAPLTWTTAVRALLTRDSGLDFASGDRSSGLAFLLDNWWGQRSGEHHPCCTPFSLIPLSPLLASRAHTLELWSYHTVLIFHRWKDSGLVTWGASLNTGLYIQPTLSPVVCY